MPYRIDLFAVFIFLGIVQGIFLLLFFLSKENRKIKSNLFHGLMLLSIVAVLTEIFLMYTGYIVNCLFLVDFSEAFGLAIGPCFYLLVLSLTKGNISGKTIYTWLFQLFTFFWNCPSWFFQTMRSTTHGLGPIIPIGTFAPTTMDMIPGCFGLPIIARKSR